MTMVNDLAAIAAAVAADVIVEVTNNYGKYNKNRRRSGYYHRFRFRFRFHFHCVDNSAFIISSKRMVQSYIIGRLMVVSILFQDLMSMIFMLVRQMIQKRSNRYFPCFSLSH